jgi:hypothetical protein
MRFVLPGGGLFGGGGGGQQQIASTPTPAKAADPTKTEEQPVNRAALVQDDEDELNEGATKLG